MKRYALLLLGLSLARNARAYSADEYLALFSAKAPRLYRRDPERFARIAVAAERAEQKLSKRFRQRRLFGPVLSTIALKESGLWPDTHDGSRRGLAGEICLAQIHPKNPKWKIWAPSFEALGGTSIEATELCFLAAGESFISGLNYCWARSYRRNWAQALFTSYHYGNRCWLSPHAYPRTSYMNELAATTWRASSEQSALLRSVQTEAPSEMPNELPWVADSVKESTQLQDVHSIVIDESGVDHSGNPTH